MLKFFLVLFIVVVVWDNVSTTPNINREAIRNRMNVNSTDTEEDLTQESDEDDDDNSNSNIIDEEQIQEFLQWVESKRRAYFSLTNQTTSQ
uniref:Unique cartilage matrix-associated protein C-terminal fragment n=1 Tax=Schistosoma mansoni TaxID=6183 RepID=A0A5K4F2X0_SCHMA